MNSILLKELVDLGDAFERQYPHADQQTLANFLAWGRLDTGQPLPAPQPAHLPFPERYDDTIPALPTFIVEYVHKAYEYFKQYMKKACANVPLLNYDDYLVLVYLAERGTMTKTEMIDATINEKPSGMLVIRRLIEQGFVEQTDNPDDRRSRNISLTEAGRAVLALVQPAVNEAMLLYTGHLSEQEQAQLGQLLYRLHEFNEPLFLHHREASLDKLLRQYSPDGGARKRATASKLT